MSRAYVSLPEGAGIDIPEGGVVQAAGDSVYSPTTMLCTTTGVGFGPLYIGVPDGGSYCSIDSLTFLPGEDDDGDGILFFGLAAGGSVKKSKDASAKHETETTVDPPSMKTQATRRSVLALAATTLTAAAVGPVQGQSGSDTVSLEIAELTVAKTTAPLTIRVLDVVDQVLPTTTEILVDVENARVGKIASAGEGITLSSSVSGPISIYLRDSEGHLDRLLSWASGIVGGQEPIEFARELPQQASNYDESTFVKLSEHPALVGPVETAGADGSVLRIGNTEIPHNDEGASEAGSYGVFDDQLVYEVGRNPPAATSWTLKTRLGLIDQISEDYF